MVGRQGQGEPGDLSVVPWRRHLILSIPEENLIVDTPRGTEHEGKEDEVFRDFLERGRRCAVGNKNRAIN